MSKPRLVNLLDDFALGGVTKNLEIFNSDEVQDVIASTVVAIDPAAALAPRLNAQIIILHVPPSWNRLLFLASLRLRNPHAKIIQMEHSYTRNWEANNVGNEWRFRCMLKIALRMINHTVCVSQAQAEWLTETGATSKDAVSVINPYSHNPGLRALASPDFDAPRTRPLCIGAYGRFQHVKGFDRLIEAWQAGALPGTQLLIGGYGEEEESLHALASNAPGISFYGLIDDVPDFMSRCDIIAVPSRWESFGLIASEAREAGRPILVSPVDGLPEQVGDAGLIVDFSDHHALAAAMAGQSSAAWAHMSKNGRVATRNCGLARRQQWANLLSGLLEA